jgi:inhibitor of cysteine peptidase
MVTFKRIDPLFVIDLSTDQPKVLGKLTIPGFSDYLHPYDATHLIGVGKETGDNEWGGVSVKGVKVALFDVSDVTNPKQIDAIEIGTAGSDSEALQDHKAFLFDKEKNLLVIPVREVKESYTYDNMPCRVGVACYPYRQRVWEGAYVLKVTANNITVTGKVSHIDGYDENYYSWWNSQYAVRRSLFMDDVLYTVSNALVKANSLSSLADIREVELPHDNYGYPYPVPMMAATAVK